MAPNAANTNKSGVGGSDADFDDDKEVELAPGKRTLTDDPSNGRPNSPVAPGKRTKTHHRKHKNKPGDKDKKPDDKDKKPGGAPPKTGVTAKQAAAKDSTPGKAGAGGGGGGGGGGAAAGGGRGGAGFSGGGVLDGKPLKAQLTQFATGVTASAATIKSAPGADGKPKEDSEEDHARKVTDDDDGVDGIGDMIGDLGAFDDLCHACNDEDQGKQQAALAAIRPSKAFHNLTMMWQGALDGGQDSPKMQQCFESQFTRRGFWGTTQQAYGLVRDDAKARAKEDAAAAAAKKKAKDAANAKKATAIDAKADGKTEAGKGNPGAINGGAAGQGGGAGVDAVVAATPAAMPALMQMAAIKDGDVMSLMTSKSSYEGLSEKAKEEGGDMSRFSQIMGQLKRGGGGFLEGFKDTAMWGTIAHGGDMLVGKALGKNIPLVGPIIMLALDPPWKGSYWTGVADSAGKGWGSLKSAFDFGAFSSCHSAGDVVGTVFAKFADLFTGFYQLLGMINRLIGTLSALCLVLGMVLIGVGLALAWLGIGAGLMAVGGWLVEAGEVLGDIALALMPVCLALSAIALVCRTAAAFMVPADIYAEQLAQDGEAAGSVRQPSRPARRSRYGARDRRGDADPRETAEQTGGRAGWWRECRCSRCGEGRRSSEDGEHRSRSGRREADGDRDARCRAES